jgi:hypothetical protein
MSKLTKLFAGLVLTVGLVAAAPGGALARGHGGWHGGYHGGYHGGWHGGYRGGWRGGVWGGGFGWGWGFPYAFYPPAYYAPETCGWVHIRVLHRHHWVLRRVWRCWY